MTKTAAIHPYVGFSHRWRAIVGWSGSSSASISVNEGLGWMLLLHWLYPKDWALRHVARVPLVIGG